MGGALCCCLAGAFWGGPCFGAPTAVQRCLAKLYEHWRWKQYWDGATELGALYTPGRRFSALFFWRNNDALGTFGFCSSEIGVCQFYPDVEHDAMNSEMKVQGGDGPLAAFRRFLAISFAQKPLFPGAPPRESDFSVESTDIVLPALDPPEAIRRRRRQSASQTDALVADPPGPL